MEDDATPPPPVDLVLVGILLDVIPDEDHVVMINTKHVELFATKGTKLNPWKWVKKRESQIGELDKLKLKTVILHNGISKEVHMTQSVGFVAADSILVAWARRSSFGWTTNDLIPEQGVIGNHIGAVRWSRHGVMLCLAKILEILTKVKNVWRECKILLIEFFS